MDSNIDILTPYLFTLIHANTDKNLLMPAHYKRNCIFEEISKVAARNLDSYPVILQQREFLLRNNMPRRYGLNETNIVYRRHHHADIIKIMKEWWFFIENYSKRDQLSCSYVLFKNNITIKDISFANVRTDKINFRIRKHNRPFTQRAVSRTNKIRHGLTVHFGMRLPLKRIAKKRLKSINKIIHHFSGKGITEDKRNPEIIVSLTSFPERINEVHYAIYSLLTQTMKPDTVILWLAKDEFPNGMRDLPESLLGLQKNGLDIQWCRYARSYQKLIPALQEFPNGIIVTADDDLLYPTNWLELLYNSYLKNPDFVHAHRSHRIKLDEAGNILQYKNWHYCWNNHDPSFLNFPTTGAGTLFPPDIFYKDVFNHVLFAKLCPYADDIWFWAMLTLNNRKTILADSGISNLIYINPDREFGRNRQKTLGSLNVHEGYNDMQFHNIILHYPVLKDYLLGELNVLSETKE